MLLYRCLFVVSLFACVCCCIGVVSSLLLCVLVVFELVDSAVRHSLMIKLQSQYFDLLLHFTSISSNTQPLLFLTNNEVFEWLALLTRCN